MNWQEGIVLAIVLTLFLRVILLVVGFNFAIRFDNFPLTTEEITFSEDIPADRENRWYYIVSPLHRFDALWYEEIAKNNYQNQPLTRAFFPLYPLVVNGVAKIFQTTFAVCAFFLNTFLTILVFYLLYHLTRMDHDEKTALRTVIIYAFFPASFFLLTPYAESLLFVLILLSLIFARKGSFLLASIFAGLSAMTKPYAAAIILPLLVILFRNFSPRKYILKYLLLIIIPLAFLSVLGYQDYMTKTSKSIFFALENGWRFRPSWPYEPLFAQLKLMVKNPYDLPNGLNLAVVLFTVYQLIYSFLKKEWDSFIFILVFFALFYFFPFNGDQLFSVSRHALIFFPLFMHLAVLKVSNITEILYFSSSLILMIIFFIYYTFGFFVA